MPPPETVQVDYSEPPKPDCDDEIAQRQRFLAGKLVSLTLEIKSLKEQAKDAAKEFRQDIEKLQDQAQSIAREYKQVPFVFQKTLFDHQPVETQAEFPKIIEPYEIRGAKLIINTPDEPAESNPDEKIQAEEPKE